MFSGEKWRMLIGQYHVKVSSKGRLAFPKKFRDELGDDLVVTVGYEKSLMVVSKENWQSLVQATQNLPLTNNSARDTNRFILGQAVEVSLDEQGRFVIPEYLRQHSKINDNAVFLGLNKYVEVWDKKVWSDHQEYLDANSGEIANRLSNL